MYLFFKNFWKTIVWACIIIILSCIPDDSLQPEKWTVLPHQDKLSHLIFYGILGFFFVKAFQFHFKRHKLDSSLFIISFIFILLFGTIMEIIQEKLIQSRNGEVLDLVFDLLGFLLSYMIIFSIKQFKKYCPP